MFRPWLRHTLARTRTRNGKIPGAGIMERRMKIPQGRRFLRGMLLAATLLAGSAAHLRAEDEAPGAAQAGQIPLPTGQSITPTMATGAVYQTLNPGLPNYPDDQAGYAIKTALSPDGNTLLVMTSGYNRLDYPSGPQRGSTDPAASNEYIFVFDVPAGSRNHPVQKQVIQIPNSFVGLVFAPDGSKFYASGGADDVVRVYAPSGGGWTESATIPLGHNGKGIGAQQGPVASGIDISPDGSVLAVANLFNDSVSVIDTATNSVRAEVDLRPFNTNPGQGDGVPGGESPFTAVLKGSSTLYVSSVRDREVVVLDLSSGAPKLAARIGLPGNPNSMIFNNRATQNRLFVSQDNSDRVAVIDTATNRVVEEIDAIAPRGLLAKPEHFTGAAPNSLAISPDERRLYVTNGGANAVAVISLADTVPHGTIGLIPTGFYPNSVSVSGNGGTLYVVNGKSVPGPNPQHLTGNTARLTSTTYPGGNAAAAAAASGSNQYILQLQKGGLLTMPVPDGRDLDQLTRQVAANNGYDVATNAADEQVMAALRARIRHVIYIVKENRTFDQVLGDIGNGANADPSLAVFGEAITPNLHKIARDFVTLDNFYDPGEVSGDGWPWSTSARETDFVVKTIPLNYAGRNAPYDAEGQNRGADVGLATVEERQAADPRYTALADALPGGARNLLPGTNDDGAPDGPGGQNRQAGYLWDSVLRAGLTVRNYGFLIDLNRYTAAGDAAIPLLPDPYATRTQVAWPTSPRLNPRTDIYFRGYDNAFPDIYREREWEREFDQFVGDGQLPALSLVRFMHDHMGTFATAIDGFNTPETQQADNDLAVGRLIDKVAHSRYRNDTLIFVVEDDAQDGPDHVDAHRSIAFVAGPYVRHRAVMSQRYTTVNMLRTIEDVLGIGHLNLNDAYQRPMTEVFDLNQKTWTYHAVASQALAGTSAARETGVKFAEGSPIQPTRPASWWEEQTRGFDWTGEDRIPSDLFNHILWDGLRGTPYPGTRSGTDLSDPARTAALAAAPDPAAAED